jgi:hypothetical protein
MAIQNIIGRDIIIDRVDWLVTDIPSKVLYMAHVTPMVSNNKSYTTATTGLTAIETYLTPSAHVGAAFKLWRGEITYKFTCLCSQFHRGRLKLSYEPDGWKDAWSPNALLAPRMISKVWDITENSSIEFTVPYMADKAFIDTYGCEVFDRTANKFRYKRPTLLGVGEYVDQRFNGTIILSVVNELVSSDPAAEVTILCEMNCSNVEFSDPSLIDRVLSNYVLQNPEEEGNDDHELSATPDNPTVMQVPSKLAMPIHDVFVGEVCRSLRQLLHRHNRLGEWLTYNGMQSSVTQPIGTSYIPGMPVVNTTAGNTVTNYSFGIFLPRLPLPSGKVQTNYTSRYVQTGNDPVKIGEVWKGTDANLVFPTLTAYFSTAYCGWRGSHHYKACVIEPEVLSGTTVYKPTLGNLQITRNTTWTMLRNISNSLGAWLFDTAYLLSADDTDTAIYLNSVGQDARVQFNYKTMINSLTKGGSGTAITNTRDVNVVDAVIPHYSTYRFLPTEPRANMLCAAGNTAAIFPQEGNDVGALDDGVLIIGQVEYPSKVTMDGKTQSATPRIEVYHAAGVDFSFFMYLNPQPYYKYAGSLSGFPDALPYKSQL